MIYDLDTLEDSTVIATTRLEVTVSKPGTFYKGSRFDWTGFITQVELDKKYKFCVPESLKPGIGTGGAGLCNEFGISSAIGYDETKPGGKFPKLGVGLLTRKDDSPYSFAENYEIEPFPIKVNTGKDYIEFVSGPLEANGYSAELRKLLRVCDNKLKIEYRLKNTGTKQIITHEYYHNFIGINGQLVGPDYSLKMSFDVELDDIPEGRILKADGNTITWKEQPESDFYNRPAGYQKGNPHIWELIHMPSGVGVKEYSCLPASLIALWGTTHVISPEVFIDINIAPGEVCEWSREYEFFCNE
ncbi:MAG: hypothetical protein N3I35_18510 [Clostridia bacterium]|nr:hypothetical protein [Clostridia bacterium]